jgi:hypothetical protein
MNTLVNYITLGQVNQAVSATDVSEKQLSDLGFIATNVKALKADPEISVSDEDAKRLRSARLYKASDVPRIRAAIAQKMLTLNLEDANKKRASTSCAQKVFA